MNLTRPLPTNEFLEMGANPLLTTTSGETFGAVGDTMTDLVTRQARIRDADTRVEVVREPNGMTTLREVPREERLPADTLKQRYPWVDWQKDDSHTDEAARIIADARKAQMVRDDIVARGESVTARYLAPMAGSLIAMATDPLEVAPAFVPVVGPGARALMVGRLGRVGGRIAEGVVEGAVGNALTEPVYYGLSRSQRLDYDMSDALMNIGLGGVFGGAIGTAAAVAGRVWREPRPGIARAGNDIPETLSGYPLGDPRADMTPPQREQALRTAVAQVAQGEPVNVGFRVYHGSPHRFDRFSTERIGTGEGAQAYGHGLYFAESEGVARGYRTSTSYQDVVRQFRGEAPDDADIDEIAGLIGGDTFSPKMDALLAALRDDDWLGFDYPAQAITAALREIDAYDPSPRLREAVDDMGHMYEARVEADPERFLDWDRPLSEQGELVQSLAARLGLAPDALGSDLVAKVGKGPEGARVLREAGLPGLKYLDRASRGAGEGSRNYVVFDDKLITMTRRDDEDMLASAQIDAELAGAGDPLANVSPTGQAKAGSVNPEEDDLLSARMNDLRNRGFLSEDAMRALEEETDGAFTRAGAVRDVMRAAATCAISTPF